METLIQLANLTGQLWPLFLVLGSVLGLIAAVIRKSGELETMKENMAKLETELQSHTDECNKYPKAAIKAELEGLTRQMQTAFEAFAAQIQQVDHRIGDIIRMSSDK